MNPELHQFIEEARFHRTTVEELAGKLPPDDAELDALVGEVVRENDWKAFSFLLVAALSRSRPVDARHLAHGAMLLQGHQWLGCAAWKMYGDVPEHLLAAIENSVLKRTMHAAALFMAAAWCQERRGGVLPEGLITSARLMARKSKLDTESEALLVALARHTGHAGLLAVLKNRHADSDAVRWKNYEEAAERVGEAVLKVYRGPIQDLVVDKPCNQLAWGTTVRRAVARVGRNESCPCGSGKKYKNCCFAKDQERLHHSSEIAGRTVEELHTEPEPHLTLARLEKSAPYEVAHFDPAKIPPALLEAYFLQLAACNLFDRAAEAFEILGYSDALNASWKRVTFWVTRAGRKDILERLIRLRPDQAAIEEELHLSTALLLARDDPAKQIKIVNECAMEALRNEDADGLEGFAYGLLYSNFAALGIFAARSTVPILPQKQASFVFEHLLDARDKLNLPPDDPFSDIMDKRFFDQPADEGKDAAALRKAQQLLEAKAREVQQLKESLERLQKEITRREKPAPVTATPAAPVAPNDDPALRELRGKVEELKSALKQRHSERNELRRELQKAQSDLERLRQNPAAAGTHSGEGDSADNEEELLLPQEAADHQPVRLIEFPRNFQTRLGELPRHVARGAMSLLGRLAAGEPAAFVGAVRLKACPTITRQRMGDHRLLFRLLPDRVQVVDLIPRQDLERKIKTLV